jgi:hypothetical protein
MLTQTQLLLKQFNFTVSFASSSKLFLSSSMFSGIAPTECVRRKTQKSFKISGIVDIFSNLHHTSEAREQLGFVSVPYSSGLSPLFIGAMSVTELQAMSRKATVRFQSPIHRGNVCNGLGVL